MERRAQFKGEMHNLKTQFVAFTERLTYVEIRRVGG
jgi:hypothetical protein